MIFPAINLHLWGIFHGYVSHNQMVIILDVWTNNMTMIPPMYGKTDEEPVFWGSFSDTHNLDQGEGEADDPGIGWRMLKVKSGNPLDLGLTLVSCRFSLKNGVLQNGIQFGRGKKLFIFKAISLKSTSCYVRWTNRIDSWNYDPRTPRLNLWLVVWICFLTFHNIWTVILPIDETHIFHRGRLNHQPLSIFLQPQFGNCAPKSLKRSNEIELSRSPGRRCGIWGWSREPWWLWHRWW